MKDLMDYFISPTKKTDLKTIPELTKAPPHLIVNFVDDSKTKLKNDSKVLTNIENSTKNEVKDVPQKKMKKDKRRKRKSDPAVKNITEILSNSLNIISPSASFTKTSSLAENGCIIVSDEKVKEKTKKQRKSQQTDTNEDLHEKDDTFVKKQNKGKIKNSNVKKKKNSNNIDTINGEHIQIKNPENKSEDEISRQQSTVKLNAFQFMMDSRNKSIGQNSPGKDLHEINEPAEHDKDYKQKLSVRKTLLHSWAEKKGASKRKRVEEERDEIINHKLNKRARRLKKLLQVDDSNDIILKKRKKRIKRVSSSSDSTADAVEVINHEEIVTNCILDVIEDNAQDRVLNGSKLKETKQSLLSFLGVVDKTTKAQDGSDKTDNSYSEKKKNKARKSTPKLEKSKSQLSLKKKKKDHDIRNCILREENTLEQPITVEESKTPKQKIIVNELSQESVDNPKTPKNKVLNVNEDSLTPRSLKAWRMKVKINIDSVEETDKIEVTNNEEIKVLRPKRNTPIMYQEDTSDESSNEGKSKTVCKQKRKSQVEEIILSSEDERETNKCVKIAPVFVKATPKPKLAPELLEAKKQFLMSGIPTSLRKVIEKQQSMEEREYEVFPVISHVQQKCPTQPFWNLSKPQLNLKEYLPLKIFDHESCSGLTTSHIVSKLNIQLEIDKVDNLKTHLNPIKADNPNYPVYKSFRSIYEKSGKKSKREKKSQKRQKSKKRRSKNPNKSIEIVEPEKQDTDSIEYSMWTDKYKPKCSNDIIGNNYGVKKLKKWLETWMNFSQQINANKRRRNDSSSGSDFDITDCDSRDSIKVPGNTIVLGGPCGSGKSVSVYAICNELGFNVIELNSSSKRTGKRMLQELQEATQSHQVRKGTQTNFFQPSKPKETKESKEQQTDRRMCVILVEDVDIVFDQDDGFISALNQLVNTSKRPIIMTTTDFNSIYVQRFISQYEYISFLPLSAQYLATWLQIVCLTEGLLVNQCDVGSLLEYNRGDIRRTLLQLQFWVQSGGDIIRDKIPVRLVNKRISTEKMVDDEQPLSCIEDINDDKTTPVFSHSNCIGSFEIFRDYEQYHIPYYLNLGLIWWNIPNILNMPDFSYKRIRKFSEDKDKQRLDVDTCQEKSEEKSKLSLVDKMKLDTVSKLYDSLALTDVLFRKINYCDGIEPTVKKHTVDIKDSLELGECMDCYNGNSDFIHKVTHTLVNGYIDEYCAIEKDESALNMSVPERAERRWRAKHHMCQDVFAEALSLSSYVDRKSVALDYMPCLRNISRSEKFRADSNTKRGNRFKNYLRNLNINCHDHTVKLAWNMLAVDDF